VTLIKWVKNSGKLKIRKTKSDDKEDQQRMAINSMNENHHRRFDE
jgi:hypothetical protein